MRNHPCIVAGFVAYSLRRTRRIHLFGVLLPLVICLYCSSTPIPAYAACSPLFLQPPPNLVDNLTEEEIAHVPDLEYYWDSSFPDRPDVNTLSARQLSENPLITQAQADSIVAYIKRNGPMLSIYELRYVPGISLKEALLLATSLRVAYSPVDYTRPPFARQRLDLFQRAAYHIPLPDSQLAPAANPNARPLGSPLALQTRMLYQANEWLRIGLKGNKAPGEPFFSHHNPAGYGFYSAFAEVTLVNSIFQRIIVGDFHLRTGQGITGTTQTLAFPSYNAAFGGKLQLWPRGTLAYPGSSHFRGLAATIAPHRNLLITVALSTKKRNASLDTLNGQKAIKALQVQPPFASVNQAKQRNTYWEFTEVIDLAFHHKGLTIGATALLLQNQYPIIYNPLSTRTSPRYNQQQFRSGLHAAFFSTNFNLWGEVAIQLDQKVPLRQKTNALIGACLKANDLFALAYEPYLYALYNEPLYQYNASSKSNPANRIGHRALINFTPNRNLTAYLLYQAFAPLHERSNFITSPLQIRWTIGLQAHVAQQCDIYLRYRMKAIRNDSPSAIIHFVQFNYTREVFARIDFAPSERYILASRGYLFPTPTSWGYIVAQDLAYSIAKPRIVVKLRAAYYNLSATGRSFSLFEPGPTYAFSFATLSGKAFRGNILVRWDCLRDLSIWIKVAKSFPLERGSTSTDGLARQSLSPIVTMLQIAWKPTWMHLPKMRDKKGDPSASHRGLLYL